MEDFTTIGTLDLKKSYHHSGPSPMRPNEISGPAHTTQPPGHKPLVVNVVVVGPFEEEEEGICITSDVVKVQGEDLESPGHLRGDRVRRVVGDLGS